MNPVGAEFQVVLLAESFQNVVAQDIVGLLFRLRDLDVALEPALLVEDGQRIVSGNEMIFRRHVIDGWRFILGAEAASRKHDGHQNGQAGDWLRNPESSPKPRRGSFPNPWN